MHRTVTVRYKYVYHYTPTKYAILETPFLFLWHIFYIIVRKGPHECGYTFVDVNVIISPSPILCLVQCNHFLSAHSVVPEEVNIHSSTLSSVSKEKRSLCSTESAVDRWIIVRLSGPSCDTKRYGHFQGHCECLYCFYLCCAP